MKGITKIGKWIFASIFAVFGLLHFGPLEFSLPYIPSYLPFPAFWVYFSGAALIAFSVSAWVGKLDKLAALLLALMMFLFVVLIHIPGAIAGDFVQTIGIFRDTAMMGAALMYADKFARDNTYVTA
ncbi:MAG: DoxX family protein [Cyclobacteriaceae bacterium]